MIVITPPPGMSLDQLVAGALGTTIPFICQAIRDYGIQLNGRKALMLSTVLSLAVTAFFYFQIDLTPTVGEFLTNAGLCFATAQKIYNLLGKEKVQQIVGTIAGVPAAPADPEEEAQP